MSTCLRCHQPHPRCTGHRPDGGPCFNVPRADDYACDSCATARKQQVSQHGPDWSNFEPGDHGAMCRCGYNGTVEECERSRNQQVGGGDR